MNPARKVAEDDSFNEIVSVPIKLLGSALWELAMTAADTDRRWTTIG